VSSNSKIFMKSSTSNLKFFNIILISLLLATIVFFVLTTDASSNLSPSCETSVSNQILQFKNSGVDFQVSENSDLNIFPNFKNLKCLGKVSFIENRNKINIINTSSSNYVDFVIYFALILLTIFNKKNYKYILLIILLYFGNLYTIYNYKVNLYFVFLSFLFFFAIYFFDSYEDFSYSVIIFFSYINFYGINNSDLNINEPGYIGIIFKSNSTNSSYFGLENSHLIIFENFIKFFIQIFGENFYFVLSHLIAFGFVYVLLKILSFFKVRKIYTILYFLILFNNESLISNTNIFGRLEPSTLSNLFFLISVYCILYKKHYLSIFCLVIATYLQFALSLILFPLYLYIFIKFSKFNVKNSLKYFLYYGLLCSPFIFWILYKNFLYTNLNKFELNKFYIETRHPHHLYPFINNHDSFVHVNPDFGWREGFLKLLLIIIVVVVSKYLLNNIQNNDLFKIILFIYLLLFFYTCIVLLFPFSDFVILNPYKLSIYISIFFLIYLLDLVDKLIGKLRFNLNNFFKLSFYFLSIVFFISLPFDSHTHFEIKDHRIYLDSIKKDAKIYTNEIDRRDVISFLKSEGSDVLIFKDVNSEFFLLLEAYTNLPTYVSYKFVPTNKIYLNEYITRLGEKNSFINGDCTVLDEFNKILYISQNKNDEVFTCGIKVFNNDMYTIYKIENNK